MDITLEQRLKDVDQMLIHCNAMIEFRKKKVNTPIPCWKVWYIRDVERRMVIRDRILIYREGVVKRIKLTKNTIK